jgi:protein-S-isoprenylcysteine O-methyltransferase Ste14
MATFAVALAAWWFTRQGLKTVFGTVREQPEVLREGIFAIVRHPIYLGAILFVLALVLLTFSLASAGLLLGMTGFYVFLCRYEEKALLAFFGHDYEEYRKEVPMLFPFFRTNKKPRP